MKPIVLLDAATEVGQGKPINTQSRLSSVVVVEVTGTFSASINLKGRIDSGNQLFVLQATSMGDGTVASSITAPGLYRVDAAGISGIIAEVVSYTSGEVTARAVSDIG